MQILNLINFDVKFCLHRGNNLGVQGAVVFADAISYLKQLTKLNINFRFIKMIKLNNY